MENKAIKGFNEAIDEVIRLQGEGAYADAVLILKKLIEIVEDAGMFSPADDEAFFCFNNMLEQVFYDEVFKPGKRLNQVPDNYADMYHKCGALLLEARQYDEAELILKKALHWNPVDVDILLTLSEVYKVRGDLETYFSMMKQCLACAYSKRSLARAYRGVGHYYAEQEEYDTASAFYIFSLYFDQDNETVHHGLSYIKQKTGEAPHLPSTSEEADAMLNSIIDLDFQIWANPKIIDITLSLIREAVKAKMPDAVRYYLGIAYELTGNDDMRKLMDQMDAETEEQEDFDEDDYEPDEGTYDTEI